MSTQIQLAQRGTITPLICEIARRENLEPELIREGVATGVVAIVPGSRPDVRPVAVGENLFGKIYTNLGSSSDRNIVEEELSKAKSAEAKGADVIIDQSTGGELDATRKAIVTTVSIPVGCIPLYQTLLLAETQGQGKYKLEREDFLKVVEKQIAQGVTALGFHASMCKALMNYLDLARRFEKITSRGCSLIADWIVQTGRENPYYEFYDDLLDLLASHNLPITLVSNRTGAIIDGHDDASSYEYDLIGELVIRARERGVSAIVNALGHMPMGMIPKAVQCCKEKTFFAPLGVLGPAVTDLAHGYDHINAAIGSAMAMLAGANYVNAQTRHEHLGLPTTESIIEGVIASRIACKAADNSRYPERALRVERKMDKSRHRTGSCVGDLRLCIDPEGAMDAFSEVIKSESGGCSICGLMCTYRVAPLKTLVEYLPDEE
jgi:phosphomethylpyrimidine synthase